MVWRRRRRGERLQFAGLAGEEFETRGRTARTKARSLPPAISNRSPDVDIFEHLELI